VQCVARDSSCDHATCPQRTFDENSQHSASNTVQLGSARKFIGTGAVRASIYSLSLSSRLVSKSMDKMQLDTKSRSGSGKRKITLMSLFNPFQSFSILFNPFQSFSIKANSDFRCLAKWGHLRTLPSQSVHEWCFCLSGQKLSSDPGSGDSPMGGE